MTDNTYNLIQSHYGEIAKHNNESSKQQQTKEESVVMAFRYTADDLKSPGQDESWLELWQYSGIANVTEGETIRDLGSGAGIDVFLAAKKVGEKGKAIGVDMTRDMIDLANKNAQQANLNNTSFIEARITSIPLHKSSIHCIISNCVINLVPAADKPAVFREIFCLLKSGGRVAVSDILARKPLPENISGDMALYVGCVAGASQVVEYEEFMRAAGFEDMMIVDAKSDLNVYKELEPGSCCGPSGCSKPTKVDSNTLDFNEWAGSFQIYAVKP